ncbi:MAG TPA: hypothetical protein VJ902_05165 [Wenzhouxiangellaceae bacterium]|nr:hypothetical protein [Wenzhouxiangellaceae bacterium]
MLPITNQRSFHIPHSIATAAAIVGLITALSWDVSGNEVSGSSTEGVSLDQATSISAQEEKRAGEAPVPARAGGAETEPGVFSGLLPLVLPSISGF